MLLTIKEVNFEKAMGNMEEHFKTVDECIWGLSNYAPLGNKKYDLFRGEERVVLEAIRVRGGFELGNASDKLCDNKVSVMKFVECNGFALGNVSERLKDDMEVVLTAVGENSSAVAYASDRIKDDKEFILWVVQKNGNLLHHASSRLKDDEEVVLAAVRQTRIAVCCASERIKDKYGASPGDSTLLLLEDEVRMRQSLKSKVELHAKLKDKCGVGSIKWRKV